MGHLIGLECMRKNIHISLVFINALESAHLIYNNEVK